MKNIKIYSLIVALGVSAGANAQDVDVADSSANPWDKDVHLFFSDKNSADILGGVSVIDMKEITEKNYSTYALDNLQAYVGGFNGNSLWGYSGYLTLVDGYPRAANNLRPEEIDQITIIKGAQAIAIYGSRGANGVILITTKRGGNHPLKISARANYGIDAVKSYTEYLGAAEYMIYYNQACKNDGLTEKFSEEEIYLTNSGINPYVYPDVNFYSSDYIKNWKSNYSLDAEIEGGNDFATFYTNIYFTQNFDYFKFGDAKDNSNNTLAIRGNVNMKFNDHITAQVDAYTNMYNVNGVRDFDYWKSAANERPNRFAPLIPLSMIDPNATEALQTVGLSHNIVDGQFLNAGPTDAEKTNVFANAYAAGKTKSTNRDFQFNTKLNFDLGSFVKGLGFHTQFGMQYATGFSTSFTNDYATYYPEWHDLGTGLVITDVTKSDTEDKITGKQTINGSSNERTFAGSAYFDYNRTFGVHTVSAIASANGHQKVPAASYHRTSQTNLGFNVGYNYDQRYYLDLTASVAHSAKLAPDNRNHLTKSASLGWNIKNESFFNCDFFDALSISASVTDLNQDVDFIDGKYSSYFLYEGVWDNTGWGYGGKTTVCTQGANYGLDFIHRKEMSANLKAVILDKSLSIDASIWKSKKTGLISKPSEFYPSYMSNWGNTFTAYVNYEDNSYEGYDLSINYKKTVGEFDMAGGFNVTYYVTEATKRDDSSVDEEEYWRKSTGTYLDPVWGYHCLGIFQTQEECDEYAKTVDQTSLGGGTPKPGDLKYADINEDGKIDSHDMYQLGRGGWYGAPLTLGLNYSITYKNLTLFVLCTGGFGALGVKNSAYYWINGDDKYTAVARDCWTEDNPNAKYPRLTTGNGSNNFQNSDFWTFKANRVDLSKVQLTYNFPESMFEGNRFLKSCQVYVSGSNLATFAKEREHFELSLDAPQTRYYNFGVKVTF